MKEINWGIIGCGDVAELKSGPAFQRVTNSNLLSVMRRNEEKAKDFAKRHKVPHWTSNSDDILNNNKINAVYIATPPSSHVTYAIQALKAGKHVYLEKPMALNVIEAEKICNTLKSSNSKLTVAHYRRKLPAFLKVKELLAENSIGQILHVDLQVLQSKKTLFVADTEDNWRVNPKISGGGYFYDLAPHHIDLMMHYFGEIAHVAGLSKANAETPQIEEIVNGIISFKNGIQFRGIWNFNVAETDQKDECIIYGTEGSIEFSFFGSKVILKTIKKEQIFSFTNPKHVQEPMIQATVNYFLGKEENPCTAEDGLIVLNTLEGLVSKY
ncbi:Gfo/Idh/MocA family protein [Maribacter sp. Asnod1-A12]|uniref:Gfo/Idh/MocA family protein n=1 Tax=Maribacter sp. Asnod1-A12 TaxID=3160576 RepID=UPI00386F08D7